MRKQRIQQRLLPFVADSALWKQVPMDQEARCRVLLARLLARVVEAEVQERSSDECREDSTDPS
jgi:hypothetical protein